jgi:hypothetical protein
MAKSKSTPDFPSVDAYLASLEEPLAAIVQALRVVILAADPQVQEQIKWNSPSYFYGGEMAPFDPKTYQRDIVVFNLHRKDGVLLVFPTGARVTDASGLLTGTYTDGRRLAHFPDLASVTARADDLQAVIRAWIAGVVR